MKSKKTYKIIACVSIWLSVIIAFFSFAIAKPKAGVIVETSTTYQAYTNSSNSYSDYSEIDKKFILALYRTDFTSSARFVISSYTDNTNTTRRNTQINLSSIIYSDPQIIGVSYTVYVNGSSQSFSHSIPIEMIKYNNHDYIKFNYKSFIDTFISDLSGGAINYPHTPFYSSNGFQFIKLIETTGATISNISNIYDLQQNDVVLIYFSDISGLDTTAYRDEITINWGYIYSNDNSQFTVHAPTIGAKRTADNIISLEMPINAAGDATNYYTIDQTAILSTISAGGATATAHIYGVYVWIQQSRIQWGLAEFDTSGLPASAASMNYITSLTSLYDYTATNTETMTCRLSISNNFNFITIKNQPILSAYNINTVIQQGGFLPAWAVYNWARGSSAGYTSGEQAGAAPYQPGGTGYQEIFEAGRQAGIAENIGTVNWFVSAFQAVDAMLNIRIFPNITIGYLVGIPFVISVVWFIIRMFRGGGSSS